MRRTGLVCLICLSLYAVIIICMMSGAKKNVSVAASAFVEVCDQYLCLFERMDLRLHLEERV